MADAKGKVVYTRVTPELHEVVKKVAKIEDRSISALTRQALFFYLQERGVIQRYDDGSVEKV